MYDCPSPPTLRFGDGGLDMQPYAQLCVLDGSAKGIAVSMVSAPLPPLEVGPLILVAAALLNGQPNLRLYLHLKVWGLRLLGCSLPDEA